MRRYPESRYVLLQDAIQAPERRKMERAIVAVLPRVFPADVFVERLGRDLVAAARLQLTARQNRFQTIRTLGVIGGSVLSIAGGVFLWSLAQRRRNTPRAIPAPAKTVSASASVGESFPVQA